MHITLSRFTDIVLLGKDEIYENNKNCSAADSLRNAHGNSGHAADDAGIGDRGECGQL